MAKTIKDDKPAAENAIDLTDATLLAYALELGGPVHMIERLPGIKKTQLTYLSASSPARGKITNELAHFIVRQWPDRTVKVNPAKPKIEGCYWESPEWIVTNPSTGEGISFFGVEWQEVVERKQAAERKQAISKKLPVETARERLAIASAAAEPKDIPERRGGAVKAAKKSVKK